jgi:CheY-like chemotaxis protein
MLKFCLQLFILIIFSAGIMQSYGQSVFPEDIKSNIKELEQQAEKFNKEGNKNFEANCFNHIASIYWEQNARERAVDFFKQSLVLNRELNNLNAVKSIYNNLGFIYVELEDYEKALDSFRENLKINRAQHKRPDIASSLQNISQVQYNIKQYTDAVTSLEEAVGIALEINNIELAQCCYRQLADNYEKLGDNEKSKINSERSMAILSQLKKKQLESIESQKNFAESQKNIAELKVRQNAQQLQSAMDTLAEIKENFREIQLKNALMAKDNELKDMAIREQISSMKAGRLRFYFAITAFALLLLIVFLIYYQFRRNKKANSLLKDHNLETERQRDLANEQKQKITDSIQYSQRIQNAILPPKRLLDKLLADYFVLFIPRDIVSGDFYWVTQKDNILILVAADCTGHGVPGALMSMLGIAFLNEIVNKIAINRHISSLQSDEILNEFRSNIIKSLHQTGETDEPKDGMDISLCIIDFETRKMQYSGAYNPLYLIRNGELIQYKGDRMPLSYHRNKDVPFTRHDINLKEQDMLYIFSDGYIDQFGGEKGFKFLSSNFRELLLQIHQKPMKEQKEILLEEFRKWKGDLGQLDDILVVGFTFSGENKIKSANEMYQWENKQILIAEDTDVNYFLMEEVLIHTKVKLFRVKNGEEAVEFCKNNTVDLILMDINMPEMNGYEATKIIKNQRKDIPIIIQTALSIEDGKEKSIAFGADDYISKPINLKSFLIKLEHYLNEPKKFS